MSELKIPFWASEMAEIFRSGTVSQFILYGNVNDWIQADVPEEGNKLFSLPDFLTRVMFSPFEVVLAYDRGKGIRTLKGNDLFSQFLKIFDSWHRTSYSSFPQAPQNDPGRLLDLSNLLPKEPKRALELIDRFLRSGLTRTKPSSDGKTVSDPLRVAVILDYVQYLLPRSDPAYVSGEGVETVIKVLDWASDRGISAANVATCLISENLADLNKQIVETPFSAKIRIDLPNAEEVRSFIEKVTEDIYDFQSVCEVDKTSLGQKLEGLSRVDIQNLIKRGVKNKRKITMEFLRTVKKEMIEKSAFGRIEFVESAKTLDNVASHGEAKTWMRQDALLIKRGRTRALPMGYLITGRIGTGKTFLVECFSGEAGIPCVALKNIRDKWVGASEGNLEAVFKILHAMGQVIVFIDEADQWAGKRSGGDGDSGLSGRLYGMLAAEMADTRNRGKIFWIFATSRPDLLEVDLKRVGRLDVHIPLFAPQTPEDKKELFISLARKNKIDVQLSEIPDFPEDMDIGGNEMEGILIRASRMSEVQEDTDQKKTIGQLIKETLCDYKPMAHAERLEFMDLIATLECTDAKFLPERFKKLESTFIKRRIDELKLRLGE
ncbi:MAG: AAA family ATPase [Candidatus Riflebacteria bacterium]|nr:AAA family ATPase [Candidatus Riflebacteria bacterium]